MRMGTMEIKTVSIIGLGALGILFGHHLSKRMAKEDLRIVADEERIKRYKREGVYSNGERCDFHYITPEEKTGPADMVLFTVKYQGLEDAIRAVRNQVGENTILLSALNGISSEKMIAEAYGPEKVLYCVAQGMDAVKTGNKLTYENMGMLVFGGKGPDDADKVQRVAEFFRKTDFPHQVDSNMKKRLWGKFMLNVGVNQTVAVYKSNYGEVQKPGPAREMMIAAMREVMALSEKEGVHLTEDDLEYWLSVLSKLNPEGKPSMAQDVEAKRLSEVELFSGTVIQLGKQHQIPTPVNEKMYRIIKEIESTY